MVAKVARDVLRTRQFADAGTLREAIEEACLTHRLACSRELIERALDLIGSNAQVLRANQKAPAVTSKNEEPPVKHAEAKSILNDLGIDVSGGRLHYGKPSSSRLVPM